LSDAPNIDLAHNLALGAGLVMILMIAAAMSNVKWRRNLFAALAGCVLLVAFDMTRVSAIPESEYTVNAGPDELGVTFKSPVKLVYLQIGHAYETWYVAPDLPTFTVRSTAAGKVSESTVDANQVVVVSRHDLIQSVSVTTTKGVDLATQAGYRLRLYRTESIVRRVAARFGAGV